MILFLLRRLVNFLVTLFAVSIIVFAAMNVLPGDPALTILGLDATIAGLTEKPVIKMNPFEKLVIPEKLALKVNSLNATSFAVAQGLALRVLGEKPREV